MIKPRLLDLFCGAGGAAKGYQQAGFYVVGIDNRPMPRYCGDEFIQADALEFVAEHGREFDVIHASPPCQGYSRLAFAPNRDMSMYPLLIPELRDILINIGKPYVIENVPDAPLNNPLMLCGRMFGLRTHRHRAFETNPVVWFAPSLCDRARVKPKGSGKKLGQYYGMAAPLVTVAGHLFSLSAGSRAMGIDWMTKAELSEAIPPAYTQFIGSRLLECLVEFEDGYRVITSRNYVRRNMDTQIFMCGFCQNMNKAKPIEAGHPTMNACFEERAIAEQYQPYQKNKKFLIRVTCKWFSHVRKAVLRFKNGHRETRHAPNI